ncbi:GTPase-activating protein and VPS9 domain-containing protein 1 [Myzus persicae]|uniref:GTPase-activating protein and VPS9 domain-containing protein 1 n=1 Tax=Myzus persicae TaxID=13164 RepID=UPI000B93944B|nr:GTPase-activating protein and VPS9 domain-containing protein 1 [Myzus persicae]XP_022162231.1 GTPase-activating protein and VPS9 domain-containing protein 1 [Myzus persicae]XP_022162232.1 GTPase-activating protein and VPS9 domain-containing protein 1 [Myzus persicae]XP_022162234.1 GTPase-activating protein and VPS9 domain-containing protein 1 [Myzus persicae]XP_022162235.1 GTPase-activating protein and VPS9 domain-containing protein 1 [Myzus persicae]XP_022162236.1 GTPase-activating protein
MEDQTLLQDLMELATHMRQERLFTQYELNNLQTLNEQVISVSNRLAQEAWITTQQRINLNKLVLSNPDCTPADCCETSQHLDDAHFVEVHESIGYDNAQGFGVLVQKLRKNPKLLASCLAAGDRLFTNKMPEIVNCTLSGVFGSCLMAEDNVLILKLLRHLAVLQLIPADNPRRVLSHGSCAFSRLYSAFHGSLFSAKLFLTAAFHDPIMQLLKDEEKYLDIDPDKAQLRFSHLRTCNLEESSEYNLKLQNYRKSIVEQLVAIASKFINSLNESLYCFPSSVCWLVRQIHTLLTAGSTLTEKQIYGICVNLVFTYFICPAIVNPEPHGITDADITQIARYNLIQVANIIQMLAMCKYEPIDNKLQDLYRHFNKDCISSLMEALLKTSSRNSLNDENLTINSNVKLENLIRSVALFTEDELQTFVNFLNVVSNDGTLSESDKKELADLLMNMPIMWPDNNSNDKFQLPIEQKKLGILSKTAASSLGKVLPNTNILNFSNSEGLNDDDDKFKKDFDQKVLIVPFENTFNSGIGLLPEHKVLEIEKSNLEEDGEQNNKLYEIVKKKEKPLHSVSHEGSIVDTGNTSDYLEVVSEAASNHSVPSSVELDQDQNDNLSDMISANVSGRGTPNISGRDTPSSQVTENEDIANGPPTPSARINPSAKQCKFDLDDKFGKFEIKSKMQGMGRDETTSSMVSDTWSMDVLASDNEILDQSDRSQISVQLPPLPQSQAIPNNQQILDINETASEAWSTDVFASDTDRLAEVDTDDTASVARSDDMLRYELESRGDMDGADDSSNYHYSPNVFRPIAEIQQESILRSENASSFNNRAQRRKVSDSSAESNTNKFIGSPDDVPSTRIETGLNVSRSAFSMVSTSCEQTPTGPPKLSHRLQPLSSQEASVDDGDTNMGLHMSSCSLASTSSSSGSSLGAKPKPMLMNGSVVTMKTNINTVPINTKMGNSGNLITKSISFDKTAERGDREGYEDDSKNKKGFFKNFKISFKNRRGKWYRNDELGYDPLQGCSNSSGNELMLNNNLSENLLLDESSEDILAKYRKKPSNILSTNEKNSSQKSGTSKNDEDSMLELNQNIDFEKYSFDDAKKKLRLVLSTVDIQYVPWCNETESKPMLNTWRDKDNEVVGLLQYQLAEATNLNDHFISARLHETIRCMKMFDTHSCQKLIGALKEDYKSRAPYITYLVKCRKTLLTSIAQLNRLLEQIKCDREVCHQFLITKCVQIFLEQNNQLILEFIDEFEQSKLADEKNQHLNSFLSTLEIEMKRNNIWKSASYDQIDDAKLTIERAIISRVYTLAMYPNGDADFYRDQVLREHMSNLSKNLVPTHNDLRIPKEFHFECPWPSAQAEISAISAYKTPKDKLQCVFRCTTTLLNLMSMAGEHGNLHPAADDIVPVLVYVLIKANPPSLLSTVQYINSFYGDRLEGEEHYWWIQFCAAIEFIKTMN